MNKPDSYEDVMKLMERVNDALELLELVNDALEMDIDLSVLPYDDSKDFKFEYAFESVTERHSAYKRRSSHV